MRTVDALIAARDFFVANPTRWTTGALVRESDHRPACFCALGGIAKVTGCFDDNGNRPAAGIGMSCTNGPATGNSIPIPELSRVTLRQFQKAGADLAAAFNAVRYANAASGKLFPKSKAGTGTLKDGSIMIVNDTDGYQATIQCFNLAIKLAKRRTIWGNASRKPQAQAVAQ